HQQGKGAKALRGKGPLTLVWQQETDNQRSALQIEYRIKQWRKAKKEAFITNPCVLVGRE
ncbi:GIY-YIG nuclease family protein, partial [Plesiomonas sp.]